MSDLQMLTGGGGNSLLLRRRMMMQGMGESGPVFVDYIQNEGHAYINIPVPQYTYSIEVTYELPSVTVRTDILRFGDFLIYNSSDKWPRLYSVRTGTSTRASAQSSANTQYAHALVWKVSGDVPQYNEIYKWGTRVERSGNLSGVVSNNMTIYALSSANAGKMKVKKVLVYNDAAPITSATGYPSQVYDTLRPAIVGGQYGLWSDLEQKLYPQSGGTGYIAGPDV